MGVAPEIDHGEYGVGDGRGYKRDDQQAEEIANRRHDDGMPRLHGTRRHHRRNGVRRIGRAVDDDDADVEKRHREQQRILHQFRKEECPFDGHKSPLDSRTQQQSSKTHPSLTGCLHGKEYRRCFFTQMVVLSCKTFVKSSARARPRLAEAPATTARLRTGRKRAGASAPMVVRSLCPGSTATSSGSLASFFSSRPPSRKAIRPRSRFDPSRPQKACRPRRAPASRRHGCRTEGRTEGRSSLSCAPGSRRPSTPWRRRAQRRRSRRGDRPCRARGSPAARLNRRSTKASIRLRGDDLQAPVASRSSAAAPM